MKDLLTGFDGSRCWASNRVWLTINESRHFDDVRGVELSQEMRDARSSSIAVSQGPHPLARPGALPAGARRGVQRGQRVVLWAPALRGALLRWRLRAS